ncbi:MULTISPECIES: acetyl-CoA carboxylase biotin carboxyl carrier protein subunit [Desulfococcus]|uniref:Biotin/lipoyl attachment domain-containing protein n=1 Tax=Desulfococcus multivorans DSM 2059 TaxID=1121405 RepID=S7V8L3_DESML|nr:acetyl-CoA carboxylase biotin carboxyl carrier protein subunit [Desulfococcus multivorans]AOY59277.1 biotin-requiring enzyme [Desulfococcus multivorans]AQV01500.1 acetyl-CoA carboxylase biotin carboxyl carrier protein subunit [Desulfococcus multivorans]EPR43029.1 biotin/lipoyl attachment domain-containing protein [Desulfococcus multivorans DSM 2059]SKA15009.1 acetyl-CoA carboxylase biotin carboxyl carrier protein [Desulfococcus multivorans DSM 2059]
MTQDITAPLAGKIVRLSMEVGMKVEEDDEALVIEAMKMETPVFIPCNGTITAVKVKAGDTVEEDDVLGVVEEA